ncbi:hypothetical protein BEWA_006920 [Theileria equi strain WA]|uniref:Signal peptide containing protein n=1 Tax=Theileria equi strain WA TaxID=1537102 RepID=L0B196_THEEQ|nr:hypothetical protein BEWA_006920 [Theileria equi strain WA]AFZ81283.1 hypothetical protein BEWA_006920 [Theileria equi strain WA]|eukprot:XP_004830949.1 hypothetical protein BEWA_006920 [Theileria equi strain WA]
MGSRRPVFGFTLKFLIYLSIIFNHNEANSKILLNKGQRIFNGFEKLQTSVPLCESLQPESVVKETACFSTCGISKDDEKITCNPQAETWKLRLKIDHNSNNTTNMGCQGDEKRFRCIAYEGNEGECENETALVYPRGYSCFTKCGVKTCPSEHFKNPNDKNDLKVADCTSGYRVRCSLYEMNENSKIGTGNLTLELQLPDN